jgi:hypothetical protein
MNNDLRKFKNTLYSIRNIFKDQINELLDYQNIGENTLKTIIHLDYTKAKLNKLTILIITILIRNLLNGLFSFLTTNIFAFDWILQIFAGVILILKTNTIYYHISKYENDLLFITSYFIENYDLINIRIWKRNFVIGISFGLILYLTIFPLNSYLLISYILQFLVCYLIIDNIENKNGILYDLIDLIRGYTKFKFFESYKKIDDYKKDIVVIQNRVQNKIQPSLDDEEVKVLREVKNINSSSSITDFVEIQNKTLRERLRDAVVKHDDF